MGHLSLQAQFLAGILIIGFLAMLFELIRRHRIQERYAVIWAISGVLMLAGVLIPGALPALASVSGIHDASLALLALLAFFQMAMLLHLTTVASGQAERTTRLSQECAILRLENELLAARVGRLEGGGASPAESADSVG